MVNSIKIEIDGKKVKAKEGITILEAANQLNIDVPNLCHHEELEPFGACRICSVEIERKGRTRIVTSCCYPIEDGLKVKTRSEKIDRIRKTILELAAVTSGEDVTGEMRSLADEYHADLSRFTSRITSKPTKCILCGLCVRRCTEATWDSVIGFVGRGVERQIVEFPEKKDICAVCTYCHAVCPTGRIKSTGADPSFPSLDDVLAGRE
jgi:NADH dehydrogenase/NADH:ubiquinone oxidoreductase subunit G